MRIVNLPSWTRALFSTDPDSAAETPLELSEFENLLEPVKNALYGFVCKSTGFAEEADDVFQNTVLRAFQYRHGFKRDRSFRQWIFAIAVNEIRRHFRRHSETLHLDRLESRIPDSAAESGRDARIRAVFTAAAGLTARQRRIFFLFYEGGFSIREIAVMNRCSANNVKVTLHRCRETIKTKLGVPHEPV